MKKLTITLLTCSAFIFAPMSMAEEQDEQAGMMMEGGSAGNQAPQFAGGTLTTLDWALIGLGVIGAGVAIASGGDNDGPTATTP